ncbi:DNA ligase-associated metallophosphoesterase [Azospirillum fermentarium]|uniref:ligase-associated DNA damage response endonuclease PdeM n=1 Tax=Azospirillum fermentarium TaxID=1233114 RepID=UPI002226E883|nr:ligase-associated DNA damage response endonuclease PdeM [Azospirillum fermentarium]MCW2246098.1 DNA ligase-associated metallophosphoesterase [Azospirillum fermentarium]
MTAISAPTTDSSPVRFCGTALLADPAGALVWADAGVLAVADLHLEKGSAFAGRGRFLPPYDTRATLDRLAEAIQRHQPARVLCLGDSFHDRTAADRLDRDDRQRLAALTAAVDWVWITGNHDPDPPAGLGGRAVAEERIGPLVFRHESHDGASGEVSGHLHPAATLRLPGRTVRERCFAVGAERMLLPAFGAYAGGLNVFDPACRAVLGPVFEVHLIARGRVHRFPSSRLAPGR